MIIITAMIIGSNKILMRHIEAFIFQQAQLNEKCNMCHIDPNPAQTIQGTQATA
jgi:hypothetical protein